MTDTEYYSKIDKAKKAKDDDELMRLIKQRANDFYRRMVIKEFRGSDSIALLIAAIKLNETYRKVLNDIEVAFAEYIADSLAVGGTKTVISNDAVKAGDIND